MERVASRLRDAILRGELAPGAHVRQEDWAGRLGVSRVPVREAMKQLHSENLLLHHRNRGYYVATLDPGAVAQLFVMRRLLEPELMRTLARPTTADRARLHGILEELDTAYEAHDVTHWIDADRRFYSCLFSLSPLDLVQREVERLRAISDGYRALVMTEVMLHGNRLEPTATHRRLVAAVEAGDTNGLTAMIVEIRAATEQSILRAIEHTVADRDEAS